MTATNRTSRNVVRSSTLYVPPNAVPGVAPTTMVSAAVIAEADQCDGDGDGCPAGSDEVDDEDHGRGQDPRQERADQDQVIPGQ